MLYLHMQNTDNNACHSYPSKRNRKLTVMQMIFVGRNATESEMQMVFVHRNENWCVQWDVIDPYLVNTELLHAFINLFRCSFC